MTASQTTAAAAQARAKKIEIIKANVDVFRAVRDVPKHPLIEHLWPHMLGKALDFEVRGEQLRLNAEDARLEILRDDRYRPITLDQAVELGVTRPEDVGELLSHAVRRVGQATAPTARPSSSRAIPKSVKHHPRRDQSGLSEEERRREDWGVVHAIVNEPRSHEHLGLALDLIEGMTGEADRPFVFFRKGRFALAANAAYVVDRSGISIVDARPLAKRDLASILQSDLVHVPAYAAGWQGPFLGEAALHGGFSSKLEARDLADYTKYLADFDKAVDVALVKLFPLLPLSYVPDASSRNGK